MVGFNKNSLDLYRGATNFCLGLRYLLRLPFTHTHIYIYIYIYRDGARNFGLGGAEVKLSCSESQFKKNSKCYVYVFVHWFNQCNSY